MLGHSDKLVLVLFFSIEGFASHVIKVNIYMYMRRT